MLLCGGPKGGIKIPTLNLYKDRRGASRKFLRNSQGGIPQKRETADCTSKLSEWICQKVTKSHLDMCMIGTELKGERRNAAISVPCRKHEFNYFVI